MSALLALPVAVGLLAANAFFVAAEFALLAARRSRLEQLAAAGNRRAPFALRSLQGLSLMLAGAQLGITMASLGLGAVAEPTVAHLIEDLLDALAVPEALLHPIALALGLAVVVFVHMVLGEMAPKSWAVAHPEASALVLAPPFRGFTRVLRPAIYALNAMANAVVRTVGVEPQGERAQVHSARDLTLLIRQSADEGSVPSRSARLLARSLELSGLDALAAMTPRRDIVAVASGAGADEIEAAMTESGRTRLVGEFDDETDPANRRLRRLSDRRWEVAGTLRPDELEEHTGVRLPGGEWDTVAGYVIASLDRVTAVGDTVEEAGVRIAVADMDGVAVTQLVVSAPDPPRADASS